MKKSMLVKVLLLVLAVFVIGGVLFIGGCGSDDDTPGAAAPFKGNVFLDGILSSASLTTGTGANAAALNYKFLHGCTNNAKTKMFVVINEATSAMGASTNKAFTFMLDAAELEKGVVSKLAAGTLPGQTGVDNTTFRCNFTADDTKIALAAGEQFWMIDATSSTLASLNGTNGLKVKINAGDHNHDALPTSDGAYVVLTMRTKPYSGATTSNYYDGELKLYSVATNTIIGAGTSVCNSCHGQTTPKNSTFCGIDGALTKQADGTYTGTVYLPGHGGHIGKTPVTITPTNTTTPIAIGTQTYMAISALKHASGQSQYKLHDVRLDGTDLYWSTYNLDANNKLHYGKIKTDGTGLVDKTIDVDARATAPGVAADKAPYYCASGHTATAFMPMMMTNEAYITVIPKSDIK